MSENITLNPCQSLALRRLIEMMKADDSIYSACPDVVRSAFCDFYMPSYSDAERQINDLQKQVDDGIRLLEKFAYKIRDLESRLYRRGSTPTPPPY